MLLASEKTRISPPACGDRRVQRRGLAHARQGQELQARAGALADDAVRRVVGAVGGDQHLEPLGGVVERREVVELGADRRLLVARRDDDAHARRDRPGAVRAGRRRPRASTTAGSRRRSSR
jgi:hypothetical protein